MNRDKHTFQFTGAQIGRAAVMEYEYHRERLDWWRRQQGIAVEAAKAAGVNVREYDVTGGKSIQVVLDPTVAARLVECSGKINNHRGAADRFQIEAAAYTTQGERTYELHPDDVLYFRLVGGAREE